MKVNQNAVNAVESATTESIEQALESGFLPEDQTYRTTGKFADGNATYLRGDNHLETSLHVVSPYLFVGARGTVTTTIYADTPWGPYPLWQVAHGLTACSTTDPTCSSQPSQSWDDYPSYWDQQRIQQNASRMEVTVTVY